MNPTTSPFPDLSPAATPGTRESIDAVVPAEKAECTPTVISPPPAPYHDNNGNGADLAALARTLRVEEAALLAVRDIESAGAAFQADGKPSILFERHIFWRRLVAHGIDPHIHAPHHPTLLSTSPGGYGRADSQHERLHTAEQIHRAAARESASWGAFQIMGFHWQAMRYDSVDAFVDAMYRDEAAHIDALGRFLTLDPRLIRALRDRDWPTFARIYNGPNYHINRYDEKLARSYAAFDAATASTRRGPAVGTS